MTDIDPQHPVVDSAIRTLEKVADDLFMLSDDAWAEDLVTNENDWVASQVRTIGRFVFNCARELRQM